MITPFEKKDMEMDSTMGPGRPDGPLACEKACGNAGLHLRFTLNQYPMHAIVVISA